MSRRRPSYRRRSQDVTGPVIGLCVVAVLVVGYLMISSSGRRGEAEPSPAETAAGTERVDPDRAITAQLEAIRKGPDSPREKIARIEILLAGPHGKGFERDARMAIEALRADGERAARADTRRIEEAVRGLISGGRFREARERIQAVARAHGVAVESVPELAKLEKHLESSWRARADEAFAKAEDIASRGEREEAIAVYRDIERFGNPQQKGRARYWRERLEREAEREGLEPGTSEIASAPAEPPAFGPGEGLDVDEEPPPIVAEPEPPEPAEEVVAPASPEPAAPSPEAGEPFDGFVVLGRADRETGLFEAHARGGARRGSALLELPTGVKVYLDEEIPKEALKESLQVGMKVHILGRYREDMGGGKKGWGLQRLRRIFNVALLAFGESVAPKADYRYRKDPGIHWFDGSVQDVARGGTIRVMVKGQAYDFAGLPLHSLRRSQVGPSGIRRGLLLHVEGTWRKAEGDDRLTPRAITILVPRLIGFDPYAALFR